MSHPDQTPKLSTWIFFVTDAALLGAAWFIAEHSARPLSGNTAFAIVGCVVAGGIVALVPLIARYERQKNETLDQRQRELEALGRTISTSAEQISIAANGFNEITDLAHKNLKQAEQLPHRLQEKVAEFNAQLDNAREDDREELEKELAELRASESERLQVIAEKIHKSVAELSKLDVVAQKHVTARTEIVDRAGETFAKAQTALTQAVNEAANAASRQLADAQTKALQAIDSKLGECTASAIAAITAAAADAKTASTSSSLEATSASVASAETRPMNEPDSIPSTLSSDSPELSSPPKRARRPRRDETDAPPQTSAPAEIADDSVRVETPIPPQEPAMQDAAPLPAAVAPAETATADVVVAHAPSEPSSSVAADTHEPTVELDKPESSEPPAAAMAAQSAAPAPSESGEPSERPARKRAAKKTAMDQTANLTLELSTEEFSSPAYDDGSATMSDINERVISSDGATRLVATAYIGIGNRLFVRGSGPGLSWEKGIPLQFVSIGKWRWETAETAAPVRLKLYKNDDVECPGLGTVVLDPGYQQEVTAKF